MDAGLHFRHFTNPGGDAVIAPLLADTAKVADDAGFALFTVMDHFFQMERMWPAEEPMLEGYTALAYTAAHTSRIQLATLVTGVTYRHPGLLAKTVTTRAAPRVLETRPSGRGGEVVAGGHRAVDVWPSGGDDLRAGVEADAFRAVDV
jgi:hypothetical protein